MSKTISTGATNTRSAPDTPLRQKLMFAASAGILALAAPGGLYGSRAAAQTALPQGCSDENTIDLTNNGDGNFDDNETVECVQDLANSGEIAPVISTANNATLTIGDGITQTRVGGPTTYSTAVSMNGAGQQTLTVETGATVESFEVGNNVDAVDITSSGSIVINNYGTIRESTGARTLRAYVGPGGTDVTLNSSNGYIEGPVEILNQHACALQRQWHPRV